MKILIALVIVSMKEAHEGDEAVVEVSVRYGLVQAFAARGPPPPS